MTKLIFGCGYLGQRVARRWRDLGHLVVVVTRHDPRARSLALEGFSPLVADVLRPETLVHLPAADSVLYAVGFDATAGASAENVFVGGLRNVLQALPAQTHKFIYISSTGVYGQSQGEWVDETSPCRPERERARACLAAEELLAAHPLGARAITLRLAGLYGPGRIPNATQIQRGQPITAVRDGFLNLIHVDDAVEIVLAAEGRARVPRTYLVSDGNPVERGAYYDELARRLHAPAPQILAPPADSPAAARASSDKRVKNARMVAELGVALRYPSYREGLAAIVAAESTPPAAGP
ncbi:MAG TPA: SDR family oxidoreductase [Pirellulales bacterium]|nr:SDR family oxidoreductase [Pirellulales bacterium]